MNNNEELKARIESWIVNASENRSVAARAGQTASEDYYTGQIVAYRDVLKVL